MEEKIKVFNKWSISKKSLLILSLAGIGLIYVAFAVLFGGSRALGKSFSANDSVEYALAPEAYPANAGGGFAGDFAADDADYAFEEAPAAEANFLVEAEEATYRAEQSVASNGSALSENRLIIKDGYISMQMEDTRDSRNQIQMMVQSMADLGAFTISSYEYVSNQEGNPYINMVIRIPSEQFDHVMENLAGMAVKIDERNQTAQDVTEEYVDLENRINAMEIARDRLVEIMEGARNTEDLLQIELQLTQRDTEIESLKGRLSYLGSAAKLSRISINLYPYILNEPIDTSWNVNETIRRAVERLVYRAQFLADDLIYFSIVSLPILVIWGAIFYVGYKVVVRIFRKKKPSSNDSVE